MLAKDRQKNRWTTPTLKAPFTLLVCGVEPGLNKQLKIHVDLIGPN